MTCGIYCVTNTLTNEIYIGSSCNTERRWKDHKRFLRYGKHHAKYLQRSYNLHGADVFTFEVIITCDRDYLLYYEQQFLDQLHPKFNSSTVANGCSGVEYTEERGRKFAALTVRAKVWEGLISPEGVVYKDIKNLAKFCREHGISKSGIHLVAQGKADYWKGWRRLDTPSREKEHWVSYSLISPEGVEYPNIQNITEFCIEHNLRQQSVYQLATGLKNSLYGWKVMGSDWDHPVDVSFIGPDGTIYEHVHNISQFAREHNLNRSGISHVATGLSKTCKGWKLLEGGTRGWR
jgi:group I intron endonuclease